MPREQRPEVFIQTRKAFRRVSLQQTTATVSAFLIPTSRLLPKGDLASRARRQPTSQGNHAASSSLLGKLREAKRLQKETARTDVVNSLSRSASPELCSPRCRRPSTCEPKPGPTHHTPVAHWPRSSPEGARGTQSPRLAAEGWKTPTLVMIKGWLKSMPPESLKPQGAGPGRTTFWGMVPPGTALLGRGRSECPRAARPTPLPGQCPRRTATRELYPLSRVTSLASPPPRPLPPRRAPTLEERDVPDPREFTDAHRLRRSLPDFLGLRLEEASGYNSQPSLKVTPVLLFIFCLESHGELHWKLKAIKPQPLYLKLKEDKHHQCNWSLSNFEISNSCLLVCEPG